MRYVQGWMVVAVGLLLLISLPLLVLFSAIWIDIMKVALFMFGQARTWHGVH